MQFHQCKCLKHRPFPSSKALIDQNLSEKMGLSQNGVYIYIYIHTTEYHVMNIGIYIYIFICIVHPICGYLPVTKNTIQGFEGFPLFFCSNSAGWSCAGLGNIVILDGFRYYMILPTPIFCHIKRIWISIPLVVMWLCCVDIYEWSDKWVVYERVVKDIVSTYSNEN